ncbi:hypothetical protein COZ61_00715 [Candidatus Berkelbacteria bacterium CG_4_8_14_3_um_filter_33_6]|uniref:Uncharacterized protein n=1 Tax=Candidatus Berkelbacteria bacterium CG_4_10_14_0_2_um_filter_35_9_33_12 TaxID=1974499 RepID=A0A2M7W4W9_9BACT|nr:MAG: hypothetical protein COX10_01160 [Candidatus Berkelbacteria bacterium CG23_combo_of_CG06-09_8_20_14_all_33_15]PIS08184.1 MAG: hypothetical protein COT76_02710 [Candidatus Berkelbacteria bacterium CG10_big_fil_rev_8_21_14_0_10_33_10]PIX31252.1 MAG: hypothetical protein COZ61_00715 [Candidatus Berkelbacteria bacterium CG_4_8_14_3_um_filter_33_6]PIZ28324.1 MAG: hypothetical protein COY43_01130 [Candidatus Berkelbacteria bacterium CG_4_10_14_0_8_um_filter_35_9_33_8]PJA21007.1 MAG: hypotheti
MTTKVKIWLMILVPMAIILSIYITWYLSTNKSSANILTDPNQSVPTTTAVSLITTTTTPGIFQLVFEAGYNLIGLPYYYSPNDGKSVFHNSVSKDIYALIDNSWASIFESSATISPGQALWVKETAGEVIKSSDIPVIANPVQTDKPFTIKLKKGWNALANPFPQDIKFSPLIKVAGKGLMTLENAIKTKIVSNSYIASPSDSKYIEIKSGELLKQFQGFVINSGGENLSLVFSPPSGETSATSAVTTSANITTTRSVSTTTTSIK